MRRWILASASPRRKELLQQLGLTFTVLPAQGEEKSSRTDPEQYVTELAEHKAGEVYRRVRNGASSENFPEEAVAVIGSDTIVVLDETILGKPKNREDAFRMIQSLQGRKHRVMTAVALFWNEEGQDHMDSFCSITEVEVDPMDEDEIRGYLATGEADDKAGAYGIQGTFGRYVHAIRGSYPAVVGLPTAELYQRMKKDGLWN